MKDKSRRSKRKNQLSLLPLLALVIVIIIISGTYLVSNKIIPGTVVEILKGDFQPQQELHKEVPPAATSPNSQSMQESEEISTTVTSLATRNDENTIPPLIPQHKNITEEDRGVENPVSPEPLVDHYPPKESDNQCQVAAKVVTDFYTHLDTQKYFKDFQLTTSSHAHFTQLIQKLLNNPPVVSRETDDLLTILQNTAHFFRIIGKNNIFILKGILDREKEYFEYILENFYTVTQLSECPEEQFSISITHEALYEYAGFFLNTMGGRLYLFRRDSISRMTVNYYAILIIDKANDNQNNKYGIQLQAPINTLISEIEATNNALRLKETYLDTLYDLKVKYQ